MRFCSASSKKDFLGRFILGELRANCGGVSRTVLNCLIENRGIRCESRHRQLIDVALQCAAIDQVARDVVKPDALSQIVEQLLSFVTSVKVTEKLPKPKVTLYRQPHS